MKALQSVLQKVLSKRRGHAVAIWGEAGIGKTYTVQRLLRQASCRYLSIHASTSLQQLVQALPPPTKLPAWSMRGIEKLKLGQNLGFEKAAQLIGTILAGHAPFILHLEDAHELEDLEWVQCLARVCKHVSGVLLLITSRKKPPDDFEGFRLQALTQNAVQELLLEHTKSELPTPAIDYIYKKTAGNPLFTLEFFKYLSRLGFVWNDGQRWRWREPQHLQLPMQIEVLIEELLLENSTSIELKNIIASKAMLPPGADLAIWASLSGVGLTDFLQKLVPLEHCGILAGLEFAHPLFKEISHQCFADIQRELANKALLEMSDTPRVVAHFLPFAQLNPAEAFALLCQAAKQAGDAENHVERLKWETQALDYAPLENKAALALSASRDWQNLHLGQALRLALLACQTQPSPEALVWLAELQAQLGQKSAVLATLEQLSPEFRQTLWFLERWLHILTLLGDSKAVLTLWNSATVLQHSRNPQIIAQVARAQTIHGHFAKAEALIVSAQQWFSATSEAYWVLAQSLAHVLHFRGRFVQEEALLSQIINHGQTTLPSSQLTELLIRRGLVRQYLTQLGAAKSDFLQALEIAKQSDNINLYAQAQHGLAIVYACLDEYQQAEDHFLASHAILVQLPNTDRIINLENVMAWFYLQLEPAQPRLGLYYAKQAYARAEQLEQPRSRMNASYPLALAYIANNQAQRGLELAQNCVAQCRAMPYPQLLFLQLSASGQALAALGRETEAKACFAEAIQLAAQIGSVAELEEIGVHQDKLLRDLSSARQRLERLQQFELWNGVRQTRKNFPELAVQPTPAPTSAVIRLLVLGKLQIFRAEQRVALHGNKRQQLLVLLLEARVLGQPELGKLELLEKLYANKDEKMAASSLKELVRYTRLHLGNTAILTTARGYCLGDVESDLEEFLHTHTPSLWRGSYLQSINLEGVAEVQDSLAIGLRAAVAGLLSTNPQEAARLGQILLKMQPYDLESLRLGLAALRACQNYKSLERHYQQARQRLGDMGEALPKHWREFVDLQSV